MKFTSYLAYSFILSAFIYPIAGHWVWGGGWLSSLGFHDFAGSTVVHAVGGMTGLVGAWLLGPRIGKFNQDGSPNAIGGHSLPLASLGRVHPLVRLVRLQCRIHVGHGRARRGGAGGHQHDARAFHRGGGRHGRQLDQVLQARLASCAQWSLGRARGDHGAVRGGQPRIGPLDWRYRRRTGRLRDRVDRRHQGR